MITLRELKEKSVSKQQQKLMGLALSYKRGETSDAEVSDTVRDLAKSMSTKELEDFASTKHKGLPQKKEDNEISNRSAALKPQTYDDPKTGKKKVRMVPVKTNIVKTKDDVVNEAFKKGDVVKVNTGPHKHLKHEVIHAFDDGTYNIKPYDLAPSKNRYRGGAVQVKSNQIKKLDEAKSSTGYELYHRDFSSAMQHAYKHAKAKLGVDVDPEEIDKKVAMGPSKPSKGKTNSYRLLDKGGKKAIQVQVYGMDNGKYELNMYKESVNEEMDPTKHVSKKGDMYCVYNKAGKEVAKFNDEEKANAYARKNHDKLMESLEENYSGKQVKMAMGIASDPRYKQGNYTGAVKKIEKIAKGLSKHPSVASHLKKMNEYLEIGTDKIRNTYAAMTPGQTNGGVSELATGTDKAIAVGAVGGTAYAAKRVKDRFNPVKVAKARSDRDEKKKERDKAERELAQRRDYQKKLRDMRDRQRKQRDKK